MHLKVLVFKEFLWRIIPYYDLIYLSSFFDNGKVIDIKSDKITFKKLPEAPKGKKIKNVEVVIRLENNN